MTLSDPVSLPALTNKDKGLSLQLNQVSDPLSLLSDLRRYDISNPRNNPRRPPKGKQQSKLCQLTFRSPQILANAAESILSRL